MENCLLCLCFILALTNVPIISSLHCYNCLVNVNTPSYVDCKLMQHIKSITCPNGSLGCAVIRDHPKGEFAQFRRECINKNPKTFCEEKKKNETSLKYFSCYTCQGDDCNKVLLKFMEIVGISVTHKYDLSNFIFRLKLSYEWSCLPFTDEVFIGIRLLSSSTDPNDISVTENLLLQRNTNVDKKNNRPQSPCDIVDLLQILLEGANKVNCNEWISRHRPLAIE
ncbi:hypothetical protein WA026_009185 [Henosepilachna vigintioctopunctata]|uniref:Uncharacterized protein n=1 Tax=Henosepilachna vigintioctopunctata TaxID=420089 RepID=A0AAW1UVN4_9CUCU